MLVSPRRDRRFLAAITVLSGTEAGSGVGGGSGTAFVRIAASARRVAARMVQRIYMVVLIDSWSTKVRWVQWLSGAKTYVKSQQWMI
jgi:hypothetical protein